MSRPNRSRLLRWGAAFVGVAALAALTWLLPIRGQVTIAPDGQDWVEPWPRWRVTPANPDEGETVMVQVSDVVGWPHVGVTVDGRPVPVQPWGDGRPGRFTWAFLFPAPQAGQPLEVAFYHDCDTGCQRRGGLLLDGVGTGAVGGGTLPLPATTWLPSKLCAVEASPDRDWHGRSGWDVELTYARLADADYWGIDDLAWRVRQATDQGLRVLVRVDYDQGQSLPPAGDERALAVYLDTLRRLARDQRLAGVYGYVLGSGYNELGSNSQDPARPVTPQWYARLFNGYGVDVTQTDNAVQIVRAENPGLRLLVGPVRPWVEDQDGEETAAIDAPWLNYMVSLVAALDAGAQAKQAAGIPLIAPDGFALHAPGRIGRLSAAEPQTDQHRTEWNGAQAGFRVYRDWLAIINAFPSTRGLPAYITSTNTYVADEGVAPAANYPAGWLTAALAEIDQEPQVQALCWFLDQDRSGDKRWDNWSLTVQPGRLVDAAAEFDALLRQD